MTVELTGREDASQSSFSKMVNDQAATAGPKSENTIKKNFIV
jgi:hypothetical protein